MKCDGNVIELRKKDAQCNEMNAEKKQRCSSLKLS